MFYRDGSVWRKSLYGPAHAIALSGLPHDVGGIYENVSKSLVAVAGSDALVVYDVEAKAAVWRLEEAAVHCEWHPLGRDAASLLVLTTTGRLLLVEVSDGHVETLLPPPSARGPETSIELDSGVYEPVGFAFAGPMGVVVTSSDGDMWALAPVLPRSIAIARTDLVAALDELVIAQPADDQVLALVSDIARQAENSDVTAGETLILQRPEFLEPPEATGPFKLSPYPTELYSEEAYAVAVASLSGGLGVLAQATTTRITFYVGALPLPLAWSTLEPPSWATVASVTVPRECEGPKQIATLGPEFAFVQTATTTLVLDIRPWTSQLIESSRTGATPNLAKTVVHTLPLSLVYAPATTATPSASGGPENVRTWTAEEIGPEASPASAFGTSAVAKIDAHPYVDAAPLAAATELAAAAAVPPPRFEPPAILAADVPTLNALDTLANSYTSRLAMLYKALQQLQIHREAQRREQRLQTQRLAELRTKMGALADADAEAGRVEAAAARQSRIDERVRALAAATGAARERTAPIGDEEQRWFDELDRLKNRAATMADRLEELRATVQALRMGAAPSSGPMGTAAGAAPASGSAPGPVAGLQSHLKKLQLSPYPVTAADSRLLRELHNRLKNQAWELSELRVALEPYRIA